jgi:nitroimidazol reductase NimA-like FMN-containing flavoprotein (pyridoxamine 5'-phosphate oxidase superfamily)/GNAT superfamily N-acetyltransferase
MQGNYLERPLTQVRRQDREVKDEEWIRSFLKRAPYGVMAMVHDGQPFVNSNLFVYDVSAHAIYLHTARVGRTPATVSKSERICFSVSEMGRLLPAKEALEFSLEYAGVMVFGRASVVEDVTEAERGLQLLLDKYAPHLRPGRDYSPINLDELKRTAVYRIDIEQWSGKKKEEAPDFPGAFVFTRGGLAAKDVWRVQEYRRPGLFVSTDPNKLDVDMIHEFLQSEAYWVRSISREQVERSIKQSLCFGVYDSGENARKQVGFARVITDFTTYAYVADVFVIRAYRGRGIGKWLMQCMLAHPELQNLRRWSLNTKDAHELYKKFGFEVDSNPENSLVYRPNDGMR